MVLPPYTMKKIVATIAFTALIVLSAVARKSPSLDYATPESVGMDGEYLVRTIDSIATSSIENRCFPGCQILVARKGKIVLHKSYGHHTYDSCQKVENHHLYDLASCTKVLSATLSLMRLSEQQKIDLDTPFSEYFEEFRGSAREAITLREFLAHQGGLTAISNRRLIFDQAKSYRSDLISRAQNEEFPLQFCDSLFVSRSIRDTIFRHIAEHKGCDRKLRYSCLSFHCYPTVIERITGQNYEEFLHKEFYAPLGVKGILYNPRRHYPLSEIVPTEIDNLFGRGLVHGFVHDETAALLGGVSGNAGLFANSASIAPILQMLLNKGEYNGVRHFERKSVKHWTSSQYPRNDNYRGLGFDKRRFSDKHSRREEQSRRLYYAPSASRRSFGHSGFTGNVIWVDPKQELIFIFLSNRVHPSRSGEAYFELNPRAKCHEAAYEAIRRYRRK